MKNEKLSVVKQHWKLNLRGFSERL